MICRWPNSFNCWLGSLTGLLLFTPSVLAADFDCMIEPRQILEMRSPIEGLIARIDVGRGDLVKKGQVLAVLDTSVDEVAAAMAEQRALMQGAVRSAESRVQFTRSKSKRVQDLWEQKFISDELRDEAVAEHELAQAELQDALDNRRLAQLEHQRQREIIRLKTIVSPVNGVVIERVLNPGELAEAGVGRKPMLRLADIEVLYVEVIVPVQWYQTITHGMEAVIHPEIPAGAHIPAVVTVIDRVIDSASGTFVVRLELPNPDHALPAGVRCLASFDSLVDAKAAGR
jgi:RND family efflux transporter MFP subunit